MKRRKVLYHFSRIGVLAKKFAIVILFIAFFFLMLLNKTDNIILQKTSDVAVDVVGPVTDVLSIPARKASDLYDYLRELKQIYKENKELKAENKELREANDKARALEIENRILSNLLNYEAPPSASSFVAKVVAEEGDAFSHSIIIYTGNNPNVKKSQVVMGEDGVVGRVDKVGANYVKVILVTDINSKIPVMLERTRVRGIVSGDNTDTPKLVFTPLNAELLVGDRIVTSGVAGMFPAGLPLGRISAIEKNRISIKPFTDLDKLEYVKVIDYGLIDYLSTEMDNE